MTHLFITERKEEKRRAKSKFSRRISLRVGDFFKKSKSEVPTTAKVDEHPPKIDEPTPVAPLENPASEALFRQKLLLSPQSLPSPLRPLLQPPLLWLLLLKHFTIFDLA
jgi:hypothetical protein